MARTALSLVTLALIAVANPALAQNDPEICRLALNAERTGWVEGLFEYYAEAAKGRGHTVESCIALLDPGRTRPRRSSEEIFAIMICYSDSSKTSLSDCSQPDNRPKLFRSAAQCEAVVGPNGIYYSTPRGGYIVHKCFKKTVPVWEPVR
jgi:hypothetical protein